MKSKIDIELFEEHEKVNFYTLRFNGEETEVDKFLNKFPEGCEFEEDIDILIKSIEQIGKRGAEERYFRPEGKIQDSVWALPMQTSSLRLYIILLSNNIVILGNGGEKKTNTYNEDPYLNSCVELLQEIGRYISLRIQKGKISLYKKNMYGNLTFIIERRDEK